MNRLLRYLWAAPTSLLGVAVGVLTLLSGGRAGWSRGVLLFWGGFASWFLVRTPVRASAMTLGHVILGRNLPTLRRTRDHEMVHVRQTELLGPFFVPAYLLASLWAALRGRHYYHDNWFEIDANRRAPG